MNSPAIDCEPRSSIVDDERTTSGRRPVSDRLFHASCKSTASEREGRPPASTRPPTVVITKPGQHGQTGCEGKGESGGLGTCDAGPAGHTVAEVDDKGREVQCLDRARRRADTNVPSVTPGRPRVPITSLPRIG